MLYSLYLLPGLQLVPAHRLLTGFLFPSVHQLLPDFLSVPVHRLLPDFLLVAFTEYTLPLVVAGKYRLCRMVLAYCDETTSRRKAVKDIM